VGSARLQGYYKRIGDGFDAPGDWGRIGNWINPRGIEGFGGTAEIPLPFKRLTLDLEGADFQYRGLNRALSAAGVSSPGSDLLYLRGGLKFPLTSRNSVDLGVEYVDYQGDGPESLSRTERYYNFGFTHQFSSNLSFRVLYQLLNVNNRQMFELPSVNYTAHIIATQVTARF